MPAINDFPDSKPYFESLPPRELNQLKIQYFEPGSVLVEEGTAAQNSLFLILSGVCFGENRRLLSNRERTTHRKICKNQFVGVQEMLSNRPVPRLITIYAKTAVYALVIDRDTLAHWQTARPSLFNNILSMILNQHFDDHNILMNCLNYEPFTAFVYYLCYLYDVYLFSCYEHGFAGYVKIHDTREDLCYYSKKDIRTINRYIKLLSDDGYITLIKGKIHINQQQYRKLLHLMERLN